MEFRNDGEHGRCVLEDAGRVVAFTEYEDRHDRLFFPHTEVDPAYEGQGLGGTLVRQALDDVRARGRRIVPLCPFVRGYIQRHPEYDDLVDHDLLNHHIRELGG